MPLFSRRDRIAIAVIAALILIGWGVRLIMLPKSHEDVRIIQGAIKPPVEVYQADSLATAKTGDPIPVDINTADSALLETLPMIGPSKAAAIVQYREKHGRFSKPADIMNVNGIGLGTYEKIGKLITVGKP
jgi:competence protein ComEA